MQVLTLIIYTVYCIGSVLLLSSTQYCMAVYVAVDQLRKDTEQQGISSHAEKSVSLPTLEGLCCVHD